MMLWPRAVFTALVAAAAVSALTALALVVTQPAAVAAFLLTGALAGGAFAVRRLGSRSGKPASPAAPEGTLALRDAETGLHAEWYLRLRAHEELRRAARLRSAVSVVSLWFPDDTQFHRLADALRTRLRSGDLAAPFGNLQIVCLLPGTTAIGAMGMVARTLAEAGVRAQVGIAQMHDRDDTLGDLLENARRGRTSFGPSSPKLSLIRSRDDGTATKPAG